MEIESDRDAREINYSLSRVLTGPKLLLDRMVLDKAIPFAEMSSACDELLLAVLKSRNYKFFKIDSLDRAILRSRSATFVFYIDVCCLGEGPGEF